MASLHLGKIGGQEVYEIHAFTKDLPFRGYSCRRISDRALFQKMIEGRYEVLEGGRPIYCTAVHPDSRRRVEENPHDTRYGTVHIAAINKEGDIEGALSVAVDTGESDQGYPVGVPLENRWKTNGYPVGASLDSFRKSYLRNMYDEDRDIQPYELAELYRHYRRAGTKDLAPRFGLYTGWYHLGVRDALNKGKTPSWLWVFDAVKEYFILYKLVGGGVLRDPSFGAPPRLVSPSLDEIDETDIEGEKTLLYRGRKISRTVRTPIPFRENGELKFRQEDVPFLDGLVDIRKVSESIRKGPVLLSIKDFKGFTLKDRMMLRIGLTVAARRSFEKDHHPSHPMCRFVNRQAMKKAGIRVWEFTGVGM